MEESTKLLTAIAALLAAVAWPVLFGALLIAFRKELRAILTRLPALLDRTRKIKAAWFEAEIEQIAANAPPSGAITEDQTRVAKKIVAAADEIGVRTLSRELDTLCLRYDAIRRSLPSSHERTQAMTQIIVKMRAVAPSVSRAIEVYKGSGSPGSRLAAIAMMQMEPVRADIGWLEARFSREAPFVFYHAALALSNACGLSSEKEEAAKSAAARALDSVRKFDGEPDAETIEVLSAILSDGSV